MSSKLDRLVQIDALIQSGGYPSVADFCRRFEVAERTVRSDLAYLRERMNAPLAYDRGRGGYVYTDPTFRLPTLIATEGELLAFFLTAELARRYLGTSFETPLRTAIASLARNLPDSLQIDLGELASHYTFRSGATASADPAVLTVLAECIRERWSLEMTYYTASRGERSDRTIDPYHLYNVRGEWQVIAYDHRREQFRNFAVSRIERWRMTARRYSADPSFSPALYLAPGFLAERGDEVVEVVVWFDERQARYIREREWHPTQSVEEHDDGALTLRFRTGALDEVRRWVLGYGARARVLAPEALRDAVQAELRDALAGYGDTN